MKILGYELSLRKAAVPAIVGDNKVGMMVMPWEIGSLFSRPGNPQAQVDSYKSWVYVCANKNAQAVASVPLRLYASTTNGNDSKKLVRTKTLNVNQKRWVMGNPGLQKKLTLADNVEEVVSHPFIDLMQNVNPYENRFDLFELTELFQELTGNAYWYIIRNQLNTPSQLWVLPPQYMQVVTGKDRLVAGYVYRRGAVIIPFDPEEICHFKFPSPTSMIYGHSPVEAVNKAVVLNAAMSDFENTLLNNNARPEGVLWTEQGLNDLEFARLKREWAENYGGVANAGKTVVLEKGLKYEPITMTPKELSFRDGRKITREEIAAAYGVPVSKLTTEAVNLANAEVGERQYQRDTILPRLRRIEEKINERVMPLYDERLFVAFDNPIPEDRDLAIKERDTNLKNQYSSVNIEREMNGLPPVPWGNKPIVQSGMIPFDENAVAPAVNPAKPTIPEPVNVNSGKSLSEGSVEEFIDEVIRQVNNRLGVEL